MQNKYEILGKLNDNTDGLIFFNPHLYQDILKAWQDNNIHIVISKADNKRTLQQNRYFHAVMVPIAKMFLEETQGIKFSTEQTKSWIYQEILGFHLEEVNIADKTYYELIGKRMSKMTTVEFNEAKEQIQKWFAELDIHIPDPNPNYYNKLTK